LRTTGKGRRKAHLDRNLPQRLRLEQLHIRLPVVPALGKVRPAPPLVLVVNLTPNRVNGELPQRAVPVAVDLDLRRTITAILALTDVEVEEVDHAESVAVLVGIENETEFLEEEFSVRLGRLSVDLLVENETTLTRHRLEDELMFRSVLLRRDEAGELLNRFLDRVPGEGLGVGIEVDGEGVEIGEFVDSAGGVGDEGRLPVAVGRDGGELGEGETDGEGVTGNRELVFVADVDVSDLQVESQPSHDERRGKAAPRSASCRQPSSPNSP